MNLKAARKFRQFVRRMDGLKVTPPAALPDNTRWALGNRTERRAIVLTAHVDERTKRALKHMPHALRGRLVDRWSKTVARSA